MKKQAFEERRRFYPTRFRGSGPGEHRPPNWQLVTEVLTSLGERLARAAVTKSPHPAQETVLADAWGLLGERDPEYGGNSGYLSEWVADRVILRLPPCWPCRLARQSPVDLYYELRPGCRKGKRLPGACARPRFSSRKGTPHDPRTPKKFASGTAPA